MMCINSHQSKNHSSFVQCYCKTMSRLNFLTLICIVIINSTKSQLMWQLLHDGEAKTAYDVIPPPRRDTGLGYDENRNVLVLFGGRRRVGGVDIVLNDTWIFEISSNSWRQVKTSVHPKERFSFVYGVSKGYFYIATGEGYEKQLFNDFWRFNIGKESWDKLPSKNRLIDQRAMRASYDVRIPEVRGAAGGIYANSSTFFLSMGSGRGSMSADTYTYNTEKGEWSKEFTDGGIYTPNSPHGRFDQASTVLSTHEILLYGGCLSGAGQGGHCPAEDSWVFNAKTKKWIPLHFCASARSHASLVMLPSQYGERRTLLYGGIEEGTQVVRNIPSGHNEVGIFNPNTYKWTLHQTEGNIPTKRASVAMATGKDGIFMFGGLNIDNTLNNELYLLLGTAFTADQTLKHKDCNPTFINLILIHGVLMILGWGFFLQWGAFIARYTKQRAPLWFHLHRLFQVVGLMIAIAGFILGVVSVRQNHFQFSHAVIGLIVMILGLTQPLNSLLRPGPAYTGEKKTMRRLTWEFVHKTLGRGVLVLAVTNISLGLFLTFAHQVIWAAWYTYVIVLLVSYFIAETWNTCSQHWSDKVEPLIEKVNVERNDHFVPSGKTLIGSSPSVTSSSSSQGRKSKRSYGDVVHENEALVH